LMAAQWFFPSPGTYANFSWIRRCPTRHPERGISGTPVGCNHPAGHGGARIALFRIIVRHGGHGPLLLDTPFGIPAARTRSLPGGVPLGDAEHGGALFLA